MTPTNYQKARDLFEKLCDLDESQRAATLEDTCGNDAELHAQVLRLLSADRAAIDRSFFGQRAIDDAALMLAAGSSKLPDPGTVIGTYRLSSQIGAGGMGVVYEAQDLQLHRRVAVKILPPSFAWEGDERALRFEREARAVSLLNHPNIVTIFAAGFDQGYYYIATEFVEGQTFRRLGSETQLDRKVLIDLAVQVCSALSAAHGAGIVHRDIKPENLMVRPDGIVKVLDFGLALMEQAVGSDAPISQAGTILGTAAYMSPEQAAGKPADARSDIFSFGVVLYELLQELLRKQPAAGLEQIVSRCLSRDPAQRYASAAELSIALEAARKDPSRPASIAVLPFANLGGDKENEYFSDGLAEEIINFLVQIPGLKVTARPSAFAFKGKTEDIRKIADTLGVTTILEGSVRRSGSRIRVTAQLINAQEGYHLWSQRYDRQMADLFDLQDEIAQAIVSALRVKFPAPFEQYKPSPPAYEALLKARHYQRTAVAELRSRAKECYEQAIALDPKFALAQCEYGIYFLSQTAAGALPTDQAFPIVRSQAEKALELDPFLPEGEAMLGIVAAFLENDWKEAARRFGLAMARDPVPVNVRFQYALGFLLRVGRPVEALQQIELGLREDPLNPLLRINRAGFLAAAGRDEEAAEGYRETLELNPGIAGALGPLAAHHASRGELDQALVLAEKAHALAPLLPHAIGLLAGLLKRTGATRRADELLGKLQPTDAFGAPRGLAVYHWILQEFDAEADWLEKAIDQRDNYASLFLRLWYGRELRSTPRWAGLMRKLNLPES